MGSQVSPPICDPGLYRNGLTAWGLCGSGRSWIRMLHFFGQRLGLLLGYNGAAVGDVVSSGRT